MENTKEPKKRLTRKFLGDINDRSTYGTRHLNAYKRGDERFPIGYNDKGLRMYAKVQQEYSYV